MYVFLIQVVASKFLNDEGEDDEIFNDEWAEAGEKFHFETIHFSNVHSRTHCSKIR